MNEVKLYFRYIRMNLLINLQYKGWPFMVLQVFLAVVTDPIGLVFMFSRFGSIGIWSMERILLIYSIAVTSFGLAESFFRGYDYFPWKMIRTGDFDKLLLRPRTLFVQVAGSFFHIHRLARVVSGLCVIGWTLARLGVKPDIFKLCMLLLALCGGMLTYAGVFVLTSGIAFFTIQALDWIYILTNASYQVTRCPIDYLPKVLRYMFTFFLPMLVCSYYPASVICNWGDAYWKGLLALPSGLLFLLLSTFVWRVGVRHYTSTGS